MSSRVTRKPAPEAPADYDRWRYKLSQNGHTFSDLPPEDPADYDRWRRDEIARIFVRLVKEDRLGKKSLGGTSRIGTGTKAAPKGLPDGQASHSLVQCVHCGTSLKALRKEKHEKRCKSKPSGHRKSTKNVTGGSLAAGSESSGRNDSRSDKSAQHKCRYCGKLVKRILADRHYDRCKMAPENLGKKMCPKCQVFIPEDAFDRHRQICEAPDSVKWKNSIHREARSRLGYSSFSMADAPGHGTSSFLKYEAIEIDRRKF